MKHFSWKLTILSILIAEGVGALSAFLSGNIGSTYQSFQQPPFAPPGWVFPVAWSILYALMGIAASLVLTAHAPAEEKKSALSLYGLQLLFNFSWSIVFFRFEMIGLSVIIILALLLLITLTLLRFWDIRPLAGVLMLPYLLWVLFASYLNIGVYFLN